MKNTLLSFGIAGLATVLLSFTFIQKNETDQEPKKVRHIKMTKIENGKKMELDTVLHNDDVFVWNGDTINPPKHGKMMHSSGGNGMKHMDVTVDDEGGNENVMIMKHRGGKPGEPIILNLDNGEDMEIVTENVDSLGKRIIVRKHITDGDGNHMIFFDDGDMKHFTPMSPVPHMRMRHSGQIIDLNDPNVISYKKKDLSGGREKIEIIRKKSTEPEDMNFNFEVGDELMPPPPPPPPGAPGAPEIIHEYNNGNEKVKIIEKDTKVDGKDGKKVEVEVESKETK
jgi:hypothetical protein